VNAIATKDTNQNGSSDTFAPANARVRTICAIPMKTSIENTNADIKSFMISFIIFLIISSFNYVIKTNHTPLGDGYCD
jgi:hypothetical protein